MANAAQENLRNMLANHASSPGKHQLGMTKCLSLVMHLPHTVLTGTLLDLLELRCCDPCEQCIVLCGASVACASPAPTVAAQGTGSLS